MQTNWLTQALYIKS